ncbi:hypothetical protein J7643_05010 [bacterium]|nr:hypothetical protein [bacterium]
MPLDFSSHRPKEQRLARWSGLIDAGVAFALALATALSAWCAYQSNLWSGDMINHYSAAGQTRAKASLLSVQAQQIQASDVGVFVHYAAAISEGNHDLATFLYHRFRPEMRHAVDAWNATKPLVNPNAPATPFGMPAYSIAQSKESARLNALADQQVQEAQRANRISDRFVLLTVFFAMVLFFAGIAPRFASVFGHLAFNALALGVLVIATISMLLLPRA